MAFAFITWRAILVGRRAEAAGEGRVLLARQGLERGETGHQQQADAEHRQAGVAVEEVRPHGGA